MLYRRYSSPEYQKALMLLNIAELLQRMHEDMWTHYETDYCIYIVSMSRIIVCCQP
jgi:hypothetical protein